MVDDYTAFSVNDSNKIIEALKILTGDMLDIQHFGVNVIYANKAHVFSTDSGYISELTRNKVNPIHFGGNNYEYLNIDNYHWNIVTPNIDPSIRVVDRNFNHKHNQVFVRRHGHLTILYVVSLGNIKKDSHDLLLSSKHKILLLGDGLFNNIYRHQAIADFDIQKAGLIETTRPNRNELQTMI